MTEVQEKGNVILAAQASPFLDVSSRVSPVLASAYRSLEGKRAEGAAASPGKQRLPAVGQPKREPGTCLCILMKRKGLHTGFLLCGEGLRHAACLPSRRKARVPCPELLWGALPRLLRAEQQKPWGGASGGRPGRWLSARAPTSTSARKTLN